MSMSIFIVIVSFIGMATLVLRNARRIQNGNVAEFHPMNLHDLVRPTFDVWRTAVRGFSVVAWATFLKWSHVLTFTAGKKFLEIAWMVRGKRNLVRHEDTVSKIWKEVAYEKERIKAHFSRTGDVVG